MKTLIRGLLVFVIPVLFITYIVSCNLKQAGNVVLDVAAKPFTKLSEYNFFSGVMNELKPNARVIPYDLITPLFTDYAHKARFIYMPEGKSAEYDTTRVVQFPVGACLIKNFYYPDDFRSPNGERRIIETRLLVHRASGWDGLDYIWNDEQTEASLENAGDIKEVSWIHYDGTKKLDDYVIPNKNQCKGCHWSNSDAITPIGPKIRNLNHDFAYSTGTENEIAYWTKIGILKDAPAPGQAPKLADWADSVHYTLDERARAYIEVNCGHCHNPRGPAYTSGLYLNRENTSIDHLGVCKAPVAAGKGTGGRMYDIIPGSPDKSIMIYRVSSTDPGIKMPELGRSMVHTEGVELLTKWIASMPANNCPAP
jgi:uncharacterized repeat protein (TIGR03806 family)